MARREFENNFTEDDDVTLLARCIWGEARLSSDITETSGAAQRTGMKVNGHFSGGAPVIVVNLVFTHSSDASPGEFVLFFQSQGTSGILTAKVSDTAVAGANKNAQVEFEYRFPNHWEGWLGVELGWSPGSTGTIQATGSLDDPVMWLYEDKTGYGRIGQHVKQ